MYKGTEKAAKSQNVQGMVAGLVQHRIFRCSNGKIRWNYIVRSLGCHPRDLVFISVDSGEPTKVLSRAVI